MELEELRASLADARDNHSESVRRGSRFVKAILIVGGACAAGIAQFVTWPTGKAPDTAQVVGIAASLFVALGGLYSLITEQDASTAIRAAERAIEAARDQEMLFNNLDNFIAERDRLAETYQLCLIARGALEQVGLGAVGDLDAQLHALFDLIARPLAIAVGFQQSDRWTIGIYKAEPAATEGKAHLRCIAHRRAIPCELHDARIWPEGVGIAGVAYSNNRELIIPDLRADGISAVFSPAGLTREYDLDRYASMAAVPITVAGRDKPWGVVNATSDRTNHFSNENQPGFKTDEPIRALAAFVALAVAMRDSQDRAQSTPVTSSANRFDVRAAGRIRPGSTRG